VEACYEKHSLGKLLHAAQNATIVFDTYPRSKEDELMRFHHLATVTVVGLELLTPPAFAQQIPNEPPSSGQQLLSCRNRGVGDQGLGRGAVFHQVLRGEVLSQIVGDHYKVDGGALWPWVYCHSYNWPFRRDRPHPGRICEGDYVQLPDYLGDVNSDCTDWFGGQGSKFNETPAR
jgi:hypothetical protein